MIASIALKIEIVIVMCTKKFTEYYGDVFRIDLYQACGVDACHVLPKFTLADAEDYTFPTYFHKCDIPVFDGKVAVIDGVATIFNGERDYAVLTFIEPELKDIQHFKNLVNSLNELLKVAYLSGVSDGRDC